MSQIKELVKSASAFAELRRLFPEIPEGARDVVVRCSADSIVSIEVDFYPTLIVREATK